METVKLYIHTWEDTYVITTTSRTGFKGTSLVFRAVGTPGGNGRIRKYTEVPVEDEYIVTVKGEIYRINDIVPA